MCLISLQSMHPYFSSDCFRSKGFPAVDGFLCSPDMFAWHGIVNSGRKNFLIKSFFKIYNTIQLGISIWKWVLAWKHEGNTIIGRE